MKRRIYRLFSLVLAVCLCLSAVPMASAQTLEPGPIDLSIRAAEQVNRQYRVSYTARLVMLEELAKAGAVNCANPKMAELRFICTLEDELVDEMQIVSQNDYGFYSAQWKDKDIFVFEDAVTTHGGIKLFYRLNPEVLKDWQTAKAADVKEALLQPMVMTANKTVGQRVIAQVGHQIYTTATVEIEGPGVETYYGEYRILAAEGRDYWRVSPLYGSGVGDFDSGICCPGYDCPRDHRCPAYPFLDLDLQLWYHDGIHFCVEHGLMIGMSGTVFAPYFPINRAMVVTILHRMEGEPAVSGKVVYDDVDPDTWYGAAVEWADSTKVVNGYGGGKFGPLDPITREQMAAILWRYANYKGYDVSEGEYTDIRDYKDYQQVSAYAVPAVRWACGAGMIQGAYGNLMPLDTTTRAQAAAIIQRFCLNVA